MIKNDISVEFPQQKIDEVLGLVANIRTIMPFLVGLTGQERQRMLKAGQGAQSFIEQSMNVAPHIQDYLPRGLDLAEIEKDITLAKALGKVRVALQRLQEQVDNTRALALSEAYAGSLVVYRSAKGAQGPEGLDEAVRELAQRFARTSPRDPQDVQDPPDVQDPVGTGEPPVLIPPTPTE